MNYINWANNHIQAHKANQYNEIHISNKLELFNALNSGYTFNKLMNEIIARYCTITSTIYNRHGYTSKAFTQQVRKAFKNIETKINNNETQQTHSTN